MKPRARSVNFSISMPSPDRPRLSGGNDHYTAPEWAPYVRGYGKEEPALQEGFRTSVYPNPEDSSED